MPHPETHDDYLQRVAKQAHDASAQMADALRRYGFSVPTAEKNAHDDQSCEVPEKDAVAAVVYASDYRVLVDALFNLAHEAAGRREVATCQAVLNTLRAAVDVLVDARVNV